MATRPTLREQMQRVRQEGHRRGGEPACWPARGYDAMTVDEVAAGAGLAKASLYKLFTSKEELAGAAMVGVLDPRWPSSTACTQAAEGGPARHAGACGGAVEVGDALGHPDPARRRDAVTAGRRTPT